MREEAQRSIGREPPIPGRAAERPAGRRCFSQCSSTDRERSREPRSWPGWPQAFCVLALAQRRLRFRPRILAPFAIPLPGQLLPQTIGLSAQLFLFNSAAAFRACRLLILRAVRFASLSMLPCRRTHHLGAFMRNSGLGQPEFKKREGACSDSNWADRQSHACPCRPGSNVGNRHSRIFHIHRSRGRQLRHRRGFVSTPG